MPDVLEAVRTFSFQLPETVAAPPGPVQRTSRKRFIGASSLKSNPTLAAFSPRRLAVGISPGRQSDVIQKVSNDVLRGILQTRSTLHTVSEVRESQPKSPRNGDSIADEWLRVSKAKPRSEEDSTLSDSDGRSSGSRSPEEARATASRSPEADMEALDIILSARGAAFRTAHEAPEQAEDKYANSPAAALPFLNGRSARNRAISSSSLSRQSTTNKDASAGLFLGKDASTRNAKSNMAKASVPSRNSSMMPALEPEAATSFEAGGISTSSELAADRPPPLAPQQGRGLADDEVRALLGELDPVLVSRIHSAQAEVKNLFEKLDRNKDSRILPWDIRAAFDRFLVGLGSEGNVEDAANPMDFKTFIEVLVQANGKVQSDVNAYTRLEQIDRARTRQQLAASRLLVLDAQQEDAGHSGPMNMVPSLAAGMPEHSRAEYLSRRQRQSLFTEKRSSTMILSGLVGKR